MAGGAQGQTKDKDYAYFVLQYDDDGKSFSTIRQLVSSLDGDAECVLSGQLGPGPERPGGEPLCCSLYRARKKSSVHQKLEDATIDKDAKKPRTSVIPWMILLNALKTVPNPTAKPTTFHLLEYRYTDNILERRVPYKDAHLKLAKERVVLGGPRGQPPDGGFLLFATDDPTVVDDFVSRDPYVSAGLVTSHTIRPWRIHESSSSSFREAPQV